MHFEKKASEEGRVSKFNISIEEIERAKLGFIATGKSDYLDELGLNSLKSTDEARYVVAGNIALAGCLSHSEGITSQVRDRIISDAITTIDTGFTAILQAVEANVELNR